MCPHSMICLSSREDEKVIPQVTLSSIERDFKIRWSAKSFKPAIISRKSSRSTLHKIGGRNFLLCIMHFDFDFFVISI